MNIFLTLDYELFLGSKTGSPENCLIRPMEALCDAIEKYGARFTIFVDAAYLLRLSQLKNVHQQLLEDYNIVAANVKDLHKRGHDIQLHIHPQWFYSDWDDKDKRWKLDYDHYMLSDMEPCVAKQSFRESKELLEEIVGSQVRAFRAGGYCLESYKNYIELFDDNGIVADSSVSRGKFNMMGIRFFDYREMPSKHQIYRFEDSIRKEIENGRFVEVPISSFRWSRLYYLLFMRFKKVFYSPQVVYADGISIGNSIEKSLRNNIKKKKDLNLFSVTEMSISSSGLSSVWLYDGYRYAKRHKWDDLVLIGHPKEETDSSVSNLEKFVSLLYKKNKFITISEII